MKRLFRACLPKSFVSRNQKGGVKEDSRSGSSLLTNYTDSKSTLDSSSCVGIKDLAIVCTTPHSFPDVSFTAVVGSANIVSSEVYNGGPVTGEDPAQSSWSSLFFLFSAFLFRCRPVCASVFSSKLLTDLKSIAFLLFLLLRLSRPHDPPNCHSFYSALHYIDIYRSTPWLNSPLLLLLSLR